MTDQKALQEYFNLPRQQMYVLCKFKCANSRIPTITGRYSNKPLEDRGAFNQRFWDFTNSHRSQGGLGKKKHYEKKNCP